MDIPAPVTAAQVTFDQAWADLEAYRKQVDADRWETRQPASERHRSPILRPWTPEEDAEYARLHAAAVKAAADRREVMQAAGMSSTWDSERAMRAAVCDSDGAE